MDHDEAKHSDYGTGQKNLGSYIIGIILCSVLTLIAFGAVMSNRFPRWEVFSIIYTAAVIQFFVQLVCFLRLNTQTEQGVNNVLSFVFTAVILIAIVLGSLWIIWSVNYNLMY